MEAEAADFRGAKYDERTEWPEGFDKDAAGLVYEPDWLDGVEPSR